MTIVVCTALDPDAFFARYRPRRAQHVVSPELVPPGEFHLLSVDTDDDSLVARVALDPDVHQLPHRFSGKTLDPKIVAGLAHLGMKKGASIQDALSLVYARTNIPAFKPD